MPAFQAARNVCRLIGEYGDLVLLFDSLISVVSTSPGQRWYVPWAKMVSETLC